MIGQVKKWFDKIGYGYAITEDGTEIFIHQSDINMEGFRHLSKGDKVEFEIGVNEKNGKTKAVNVKKFG